MAGNHISKVAEKGWMASLDNPSRVRTGHLSSVKWKGKRPEQRCKHFSGHEREQMLKSDVQTHSLPQTAMLSIRRVPSRIAGAWQASEFFQAVVIGGGAWLLLCLLLVL